MKGKLTKPTKQQQVLDKNENGQTSKGISSELGVPLSTIRDVIHRGKVIEKRNLKKKLGRKRRLTTRDQRAISRELKRNPNSSASKIKSSLNLLSNVRTVQRQLHRLNYERRKMKVKPTLTEKQKRNRLEFAKDHVTWTDDWNNVVFTDEKKWNLDGPDGYNYYWQNLNKFDDQTYFSKDPYGKQSVMVLGAISYEGKLELLRVDEVINSRHYCQMIENHLYPDAHALFGEDFILQQDRSSSHVSKETLCFLENWNIEVMDWPAKSPDLNPIENVWGILTRMVFHDGAVYDTKDQLWRAIKSCWENLSMETIQSLVDSMNSRMIKVIEKNGAMTKY